MCRCDGCRAWGCGGGLKGGILPGFQASGNSGSLNCLTPFPTSCLPQGDCLDPAVELILKQFKTIKKSNIAMIEGKKKVPYFDDEDDEEDES